jgi:EAL domain-containing protein (putative c-di-GMP-specific phosphodiesterase class I)
MGITLFIDDFGTGYSFLSYLKQFPFSTIIDRFFIQNLANSLADIAIVDAIITLSRGLRLNIVAEGVETVELKELLRDLGCKYIQGYLFSKSLPVDEATKLLCDNLGDEIIANQNHFV